MEHWAGFVLTGGRSSRMGTDKARLAAGGIALAERAARMLERVCESVALVGNPAKHDRFGRLVLEDEFPGCGPLGGIVTALSQSTAGWNLILACDMPSVTVEFLETLRRRAEGSHSECVVPCGPSGGMEPLCAAYRKNCDAKLRAALREGTRKTRDAVQSLRCDLWKLENGALFRNVNTPDDWERFLREQQPQ